LDVGNRIGDAEAASLVPALEKMPQLTYLEISCARIGLGRGWSEKGFGSLGCFSGVLFEGSCCGDFGVRVVRFADDGVRGVCVRGGDGCSQSHRA
jgi:hypothetical protein